MEEKNLKNVRWDMMLTDPYQKIRGLAGLFHGTGEETLVDFSGEEIKGISLMLTEIAEGLLTVKAGLEKAIIGEKDKTAKETCEKLDENFSQGEERGVKFNITLLEGAFYNLKEIGNALRFIHDVSVTEISTEHPRPFGDMASSLVDISLGHFDHVLSYLEAIFDGLDYNHY